MFPSTRRISPFEQGADYNIIIILHYVLKKSTVIIPSHLTPASSECSQLWLPIVLLEQALNSVSDEVQATSSNQILPVPWPKYALENASPSV